MNAASSLKRSLPPPSPRPLLQCTAHPQTNLNCPLRRRIRFPSCCGRLQQSPFESDSPKSPKPLQQHRAGGEYNANH